MAIDSRSDLASRHGSIVRIAAAYSWFYRSDNPICTRIPNGLSGMIPDELGNLTNLEALYLNQNLLRGVIPVELGRLTSLEVLSLWDNELSGTIPVSLTNLWQLRVFWFQDNAGLCMPSTAALQT